MKKVIMGAALIVAGISLIPQGWAAEEKGCAEGGGCDNVGTSQPGAIGSEANEAGAVPPPQKQFKLWDETQVWRHVEWAKSPRKSLIGFAPCDPIPKALGVPPADPRRLKFLEDLRIFYCNPSTNSDDSREFLLKLLNVDKINVEESSYATVTTYTMNHDDTNMFKLNFAYFRPHRVGLFFGLDVRKPYQSCITTENLESIFGFEKGRAYPGMSINRDITYTYTASSKRMIFYFINTSEHHKYEYSIFNSLNLLDYCLKGVGYS